MSARRGKKSRERRLARRRWERLTPYQRMVRRMTKEEFDRWRHEQEVREKKARREENRNRRYFRLLPGHYGANQ